MEVYLFLLLSFIFYPATYSPKDHGSGSTAAGGLYINVPNSQRI